MSIFQDAETACLDEEQGYTIRQLDQAVMDYYGFQHQLRKLAGECGELIAAISHFQDRRSGSRDELLDEIADVRNMARQICRLLHADTRKRERDKMERAFWEVVEKKDAKKGRRGMTPPALRATSPNAPAGASWEAKRRGRK